MIEQNAAELNAVEFNAIEFNTVTKRYGKTLGIDGLSLAVSDPGIYCLLGRNGAGKTTLFKLLAGHISATSGTVSAGGKTVGPMTMPEEVHFVESTAPHFNVRLETLFDYARRINRMDFFISAGLTYLCAAATVTVISLAMELFLGGPGQENIDWLFSLFEVFGFKRNGPGTAFLRMTAFLLLFCCVLHTLTLVQGRWYGWVIDGLLIAIISVFTPIAPLRAALGWFFTMIIFHDSALVQILSCIVLSAAVYAASLIPIKNKI
jgi:hypothetical protein